MHNYQWQSVRGGGGGEAPNILIFWLFLDNLSISEQTIKQGINNSHRTIKL